MRNTKVLLDFLKYPIPEKIEFGRNSVTKMQPIYDNPDVAYAEITALTLALEVKYNMAIDGGKTLKASLRKAEAEWKDAMTFQAYFINRMAKHDEVIIRDAGFHPTRQYRQRVREDLEVRHGKNSGEVILRCIAGKQRTTQLWQYREVSESGTSDWIDLIGTIQHKTVAKNLNTKTTYEFRYSRITATGPTDWCAPVSIFVL